jgi:hypothetical protein
MNGFQRSDYRLGVYGLPKHLSCYDVPVAGKRAFADRCSLWISAYLVFMAFQRGRALAGNHV